MADLLVVGILLVIVGFAVFYIWKEKKKGRGCIGCPAAGCCSKNACQKAKEHCKCHTGSN